MFVYYKLYESVRINFLKYARFLRELDTKKTIGFDLKRMKLTKNIWIQIFKIL